jgi:subtilisin family serine protease
MDNYILKRGNSTIELQKNEDLIALKPTKTKSGSMLLKSFINEPLIKNTEARLGGFQIVSVKNKTHEKTLDSLRENSSVAVGSHVYNTPESNVPFVPTGKITIRFNENTNEDQQNEIIDNYKLQILNTRVKENPDGSKNQTYIVSVTKESPNPLKVAYELQQLDTIKLAEPDLATTGKLKGFNLPTDDLLAEQWHLSNTGIAPDGSTLGLKKGADANVIKAWEKLKSLGSPDCIVAIIDDGFDLSHPDFKTPNKIISPWDFEYNSKNPTPKTFEPDSGDWHGTSCAGVAVGASNGKGVVGAAPDCRLMPVRWSAELSDESIEEWFGYVTTQGASIVSCSWGAEDNNYVLSTRQHEAIEDCAKKGRNGFGCVIVFAAGNSNHDVNDPKKNTVDGFAIHPDVICVAASTSRDQKADYSNYGKEINICAPSSGSGGRGILTADVTGSYKLGKATYFSGYDESDYTRDFGGTSSATPLVSGICALILSANPNLKATDVKRILEKTARKIGNATSYKNGRSPHFGFGCVDAEAAVAFALNEKANSKPVVFWGKDRHELIAELADGMLTDKAREAVSEILSKINKSTLKSIAVWADDIKYTPDKFKDPDTLDFLKKYKREIHGSWHFVDLPLGLEKYDRVKFPEFTKDDDVVQVTRNCIRILLGKSDSFSKLNALRWLAHLLGDIHQPIHVGCGFILDNGEKMTLEYDPKIIIDNKIEHNSDQGGNKLILPNDQKLHSYWDSGLPGLDNSQFEHIEQEITSRDKLEELPALWASETLLQARIAYQSLKITKKVTDGKKNIL